MLKGIIIGLTVGDGVLLLLGGTCVIRGVGEDYRPDVEVTDETGALTVPS